MLRSSASSDRPILVLGAGLTGMSAALELSRLGVEHWIIEKQHQVGGLATTWFDSGYRFDRTGHLLHLRSAERRERISALLEEPPLIVQRRSLVYSEGVFTRYPYQSNTHGLAPESAYACVLDFVKARLNPTTETPTDFEQYCRLHFGNAIAERFMIPYNRRLWGVEPSEITTEWCQRFVPVPTIEDVLAGALGHRSRELGYNVEGIYPTRGIGELTDAMGRRLSSLILGAKPRRIDPVAKRVDFDDWSSTYTTLISTVPLPTLLTLLGQLPQPVAEAARLLRCAPLYYLDVALRRRPRLDAHWVYVPEERFPFYRVGNYAEFSEQMAPADCACLYVELADRSEPQLDQLWPALERGLRELQFIQGPDDVAFCRVRRIDHAYVIYDRYREGALALIADYLQSHDIISTGRYGGWNYSSMEDAIEFGEVAARIAAEDL